MKTLNKIWFLLLLLQTTIAQAQVFNGQQVNAAVTNNAFWKRSVNDSAVGEYALQSPISTDGAFVNNIQASINACDSYTGLPANSAYNALPSWLYNYVGTSTDTLKARGDALTHLFDGTVGHKHTGVNGDGPQLGDSAIASNAQIARTKIAVGTAYAVVTNDVNGFVTNGVAPCTNGVLATVSGQWACSTSAGGGGGGVVEFKAWGKLNGLVNDFGETHYWDNALTFSTIDASMENCGTTGSTTFNVNQWRSGSIIDTATGSLSASGGVACGATITLSHAQNIQAGDLTTVDLTGLPSGSPRTLTLALTSGSMAGPPGTSNVFVRAAASNYTMTVGYDNVLLVDATAGNVTVTLPSAFSAVVGGQSVIFTVKKIDSTSHSVIVSTNGTDHLDGSLTQTLTTQWQALVTVSSGGNWYVQ